MRRLILLLVCTPLLAQDAKDTQDLRPRYGDGFAGFKAGTYVRMKLTRVIPNRVPTVTITTSTLKEVGKETLTIERVSENPLTDPTKTTSEVPLSGNAGKGEKETVKKLDDETIEAAGKKWECTKSESTITGPTGKRVITEWVAKKPLLRVKRITKRFGPDGQSAGTVSLVLSKLPEERLVGERKVPCIGYRTIDKMGEVEQRMDTWHSREVPGDFADGEVEVYFKGKLQQTLHLKVLRFAVK